MARTDAPSTQTAPVDNRPKTLQELQNMKKELLDVYTTEQRDTVAVSPMYAPYFGNVMTVNINTVVVRVRIDGSPQKIPLTFADEVRRRVLEVDKQIRRANRMSNIQENFEHSPGELMLY